MLLNGLLVNYFKPHRQSFLVTIRNLIYSIQPIHLLYFFLNPVSYLKSWRRLKKTTPFILTGFIQPPTAFKAAGRVSITMQQTVITFYVIQLMVLNKYLFS